MAKKPKKTPNDIADELISVETDLNELNGLRQTLLTRKEFLREDMLAAIKKDNLKSVKTMQGVTFSRAFRASLSISNPDAALRWALAHDCAQVDKVRAGKALRGAGALPEGFVQEETEYLKADGIKATLEN